ncbi:MAG: tetratricopeptide repeat protein [Verrucomicrobiota bacterium]
MNPWREPFLAERLLPRVVSVCCRFVIGAGLLAGPLPSAGVAAPLGRPRTAEHAVATDSERTPKPPAAPDDLGLSREGERKAQALAAYAQGLLAEDDGDNDRAFEAYRRSLAADANNTELSVKVAFELARRGEVAEGIGLLKDAAKAAPKDSLPPLCLSQIYAKFLKKPALAIKHATTAMELDPGSIGPYLALIELYSQGGQAKKAEEILEKALKSDSEDADFWLQLAELCTRLDVQGEGRVLPEKLRRLNHLFQKALAYDPANPETIVKAADFYFNTKQFEPAIPLYRKAIAAEEEPGSEDALSLRDKLARALMDSGHRDQALGVLRAMADDAPQRAGTQALLGDVHLLDGRLEEALAAYREVIRLDPSIAPAYLRVADLQMRLSQSEQALATLAEAHKKFPGAVLVTYSLAATLAQAHQYAQALPVFEETLREAPASKPNLLNASFYFAYGMAAEQAGELERAAALLQKSIALAPEEAAPARNYLGYMWIERGMHLREAGELIRRALAQEPKNGAYLDSLGWYDYKMGDYPQATANLLKAIAALPEPDPVVFEHLGDAYAASGDAAKALDAWKKALALDAGNKALAAKVEKAQGKP